LILIGFESLDPRNLKQIGKSANKSIEQYEKGINNLRKYRIWIYATFVFGYDYDTKESFKEAVDFSNKHKFCLAAFNHLVPFPGTDLYTQLKEEKKLLNEKWWLDHNYHFGDVILRPKNMTSDELSNSCYNSRKEFYTFKSISKRLFSIPNFHLFFLYTNIIQHIDVERRQGLPMGFEQ